MGRYFFILILSIFNIIFATYTVQYLVFYVHSEAYITSPIESIEIDKKLTGKSVKCNVSYSFLANGSTFESSKLAPWQKGESVNGRELACNFIDKESIMVKYDPDNPKNSFLEGEPPVVSFITQLVLAIFLVYFIFSERRTVIGFSSR